MGRVRDEQTRNRLGVQLILESLEQRYVSWCHRLHKMNDNRSMKKYARSRLRIKRKMKTKGNVGKPEGMILEVNGKDWSETKVLVRHKGSHKFVLSR